MQEKVNRRGRRKNRGNFALSIFYWGREGLSPRLGIAAPRIEVPQAIVLHFVKFGCLNV